jgi:hypothetical protein
MAPALLPLASRVRIYEKKISGGILMAPAVQMMNYSIYQVFIEEL